MNGSCRVKASAALQDGSIVNLGTRHSDFWEKLGHRRQATLPFPFVRGLLAARG